MIIIEIFENGAILIENPKSNTQFKVNGQRLKPYVEIESQDSTSLLAPEVYTFQDPNRE